MTLGEKIVNLRLNIGLSQEELAEKVKEETGLSKEYIEICEKTANILNLDYCGIDILEGEDGKPVVCEVNSNAFFNEAEKVTGVNIAGAYAKHIVNEMNK